MGKREKEKEGGEGGAITVRDGWRGHDCCWSRLDLILDMITEGNEATN